MKVVQAAAQQIHTEGGIDAPHEPTLAHHGYPDVANPHEFHTDGGSDATLDEVTKLLSKNSVSRLHCRSRGNAGGTPCATQSGDCPGFSPHEVVDPPSVTT